MPQDFDISALYRGAINLWVEDRLTKEFLEIAWGATPEVVILIAGGSGGVRAILEDVRNDGYSNVFGLIDGDFQRGDTTRWREPNDRFAPLVLPVHEVENYLLDPDALADCDFNNIRRSTEWIADAIRRKAIELAWWKACKEVLAYYSNLFRSDYPEDPKCPAITNLSDAEAHILNHPKAWFPGLADKTFQADQANVRQRLVEAKNQADLQIADQEWKVCFPGKEVFRHIQSMIYDSRGHRATTSERDVDIAKAVARRQVETGTIAPDVLTLLGALRFRVGIPSQGSA